MIAKTLGTVTLSQAFDMTVVRLVFSQVARACKGLKYSESKCEIPPIISTELEIAREIFNKVIVKALVENCLRRNTL